MDEGDRAGRAALCLLQGVIGMLVQDKLLDGDELLLLLQRMEDKPGLSDDARSVRSLARLSAEPVIDGMPK